MKIRITLLLIAFLPTFVSAQKVYKCDAPNGSVVFSHDPCGTDAKVIDTSIDNKFPAANDGSDRANANAIENLDRVCERRVNAITLNSNAQIKVVSDQLGTLRYEMNYSNNSLAGAQRDTGIDTQIKKLEGRIAAMEMSRNDAVRDTRDRCQTQREAALQQQQADKQQREATQAAQQVIVSTTAQH